MSSNIAALVAHGRWIRAERRNAVAERLAAEQSAGTLLVTTCHRVELYGPASAVDALAARLPDVRTLRGSEAARHLIGLAVGRDSAVVGEDQVLHQLRLAARHARENGGMPPDLGRLVDLALHAGRIVRSWLPASRPTLADIALARVASVEAVSGARVHVVGAGAMGLLAVRTLLARGAIVTVSSRTIESARALATRFGIGHTRFVPETERLTELSGLMLAVAGPWPLSPAAASALIASKAWVVDLSAPPAIEPELARSLGDRTVTIDDLLEPIDGGLTKRVLDRIDALVEQTLAEYGRWLAEERHRATAEALAIRARDAQAMELERLWQRAPTLDDTQRAEVERTIEHLTERLLREPLEQLRYDSDGRQSRAARELFRL